MGISVGTTQPSHVSFPSLWMSKLAVLTSTLIWDTLGTTLVRRLSGTCAQPDVTQPDVTQVTAPHVYSQMLNRYS